MDHERQDLLLHRALELEADARDWNELEALAREDPGVWRQLAALLRDQGTLHQAMETRLAVAERVTTVLTDRASGRVARFGGWSGWAAAALVLVTWFLSTRTGLDPADLPARNSARQSDRVGSDGAAAGDPAIARAANERRRVGELPSLMLESSPAADGDGYEVLYVRRTLERIRVDEFHRLAENEYGESMPVPTRWTPSGRPRRM